MIFKLKAINNNSIMGSYLSAVYSGSAYYIHWFTDRNYIDVISNLNDELIQRFNCSLTYSKSIQLYDALHTIKSENMSFGIGRGLLDTPVIIIIADENPMIVFSLCSCCSELGIITDNRKK